MNKAKIFLTSVLCMALIVAVSVMGTLAYLTDRESVTNTFTVGNVNITLDEAAVNPDGTPILNADRVKGNEYHLIPGQTYTKDPTMTVEAGSEESFVRMLVTINKASELKAIFPNFLPQNYVEGWDVALWPCVNTKDNGDNTITYEFRYKETVDGFNDTGAEAVEILPALFTKFTLPGTVTGEQLETIKDLAITVNGHAIQAAGFEGDADAAWVAFAEQYK